jgi:hypothetical protein
LNKNAYSKTGHKNEHPHDTQTLKKIRNVKGENVFIDGKALHNFEKSLLSRIKWNNDNNKNLHEILLNIRQQSTTNLKKQTESKLTPNDKTDSDPPKQMRLRGGSGRNVKSGGNNKKGEVKRDNDAINNDPTVHLQPPAQKTDPTSDQTPKIAKKKHEIDGL